MNTTLFSRVAQEEHRLTVAKRAETPITWGNEGRHLFHVDGKPVGYPSHCFTEEAAKAYAELHGFASLLTIVK